MSSPVKANRAETLWLLVWMMGLNAAGLALAVVSWALDFGFLGYMFASILMLTGILGAGSLLATGGSWQVSCPACGQSIGSLQLDQRFLRTQPKIFACPHCGSWSHGVRAIELVPPDYVHPTPVFDAPLPETFSWPSGCPVCRQAATAKVRLEGHDAVGVAVTSVTGGVRRVVVIEAPCCDQHQDGVSVGRGEKGDRIRFRSFDYWRRWVEAQAP